jgi:hypothetical protein
VDGFASQYFDCIEPLNEGAEGDNEALRDSSSSRTSDGRNLDGEAALRLLESEPQEDRELERHNDELNKAFPAWRGQFLEARRPDGVHSIIVPRLFGAYMSEMKTEYDKSANEIAVKDSLIGNYKESLVNKDSQVRMVTLQKDSIATNYRTLFSEYEDLNDKYNSEVKSHWFKFTLGNAVYTGIGFGTGYLLGKN